MVVIYVKNIGDELIIIEAGDGYVEFILQFSLFVCV